MPIVRSQFRAAWWLKNRHLQTLWAVFLRSSPKLAIERERVELPDGDFLDLDWLGKEQDKPLLLVLHGLGGSIRSHYAANLAQAAANQGLRCVVMHFRGCSGEPNRLRRNYHSGDTADLHHILTTLLQRDPAMQIYACGFSMGGNVLLKYLGEHKGATPIKAASAICVPLDLKIAASELQQGFSRVYQWKLIRELKRYLLHKTQLRRLQPLPVDWETINTFFEFDNQITAPLHGFKDVDDYYQQASCKQYLKDIAVPTLVLHASDDPFMNNQVLPKEHEIAESITLEIAEKGGHVGFIGGKIPGLASYWLEERLLAFFNVQQER